MRRPNQLLLLLLLALAVADEPLELPLTPRPTPDGGWRYLLPLAIGTPEQNIPVMMDTGSHHLLVRDSAQGACAAGEPPGGVHVVQCGAQGG